MCGKDGSTELLSSSPVCSASPSSKPRKKRSFQSIVRNSFTLLGGSRTPPVPASSPAPSLVPPPMVTMVGPPPTFGMGYAPGTSSLGFAGCSSSVSGPDSIFRPSWTLAHDADGQDQAFASQFAQHAFPPAMVSRFDGLDYADVQTQYYSHATNALACAASLARRNEKERSDAQKRVEVAEAQAREYKSAYDEMTDQMSTLRFERDGLLRREERYVETEKSHVENMDWMLHHGIRDTFQHCFTSGPFVDNALSLYHAIGEAGAERGARDTRDKFNLSFPDEEIPGYQPGRGAAAEEALKVFDETDYVGSSGLDFSNYHAFRASFPHDASSDQDED